MHHDSLVDCIRLLRHLISYGHIKAIGTYMCFLAFSHQYQHNFLSKTTDYFSHMLQQRWEAKICRKESSLQPGVELTTTRPWVQHAHHWATRRVASWFIWLLKVKVYRLSRANVCITFMSNWYQTKMNQSVENAGVAFVEGANGRNEFFEKITRQ